MQMFMRGRAPERTDAGATPPSGGGPPREAPWDGIPGVALRLRDGRERHGHVARLRGPAIDPAVLAGQTLQRRDQLRQGHRVGAPEVGDLEREIGLQRRLDPVGDVVDVGVVATRAAVAEEGDGLVRLEAPEELGDREVGRLPGAEDGEEAEARGEAGGADGGPRRRAARRRVWSRRRARWGGRRVGLGEGQLGVDAVHPGTRRRRSETPWATARSRRWRVATH